MDPVGTWAAKTSAKFSKRPRGRWILPLLGTVSVWHPGSAVKTVKKAVDAGDKDAASEAFAVAQRVIDRLADKRIVHANKAARHKSRLSKAIRSMA